MTKTHQVNRFSVNDSVKKWCYKMWRLSSLLLFLPNISYMSFPALSYLLSHSPFSQPGDSQQRGQRDRLRERWRCGDRWRQRESAVFLLLPVWAGCTQTGSAAGVTVSDESWSPEATASGTLSSVNLGPLLGSASCPPCPSKLFNEAVSCAAMAFQWRSLTECSDEREYW